MANMSYCRFENTTKDMDDCFDSWDDFDMDDASDYEKRAYVRFLEMIVENAEGAQALLEDLKESTQ